jgi:hypothetical protein
MAAFVMVDYEETEGRLSALERAPARDEEKINLEYVDGAKGNRQYLIEELPNLAPDYCNVERNAAIHWLWWTAAHNRGLPVVYALILNPTVTFRIIESKRLPGQPDGTANVYYRVFVEFEPGISGQFKCNGRDVRKAVVAFHVTNRYTIGPRKTMVVSLGDFSGGGLSSKALNLRVE